MEVPESPTFPCSCPSFDEVSIGEVISLDELQGDGLNVHPRKRNHMKVLGVTAEEMKRWSALKRMGLTNDDFEIGCQIMTEGRVEEDNDKVVKKPEQLTGYRYSQIKREKALGVLGTTEEEIEEVKSKRLSSLGTGHSAPPFGRARSGFM